jgi:hypothetical protein
MKTLYLVIISLGIVMIGINSSNVYAPCVIGPNGTQECAGPPPWPITAQTDKSLYLDNETIVISGHVLDQEPGKTIHIQIYNSTFAMVRDYQAIESANGTFILRIKADLGTTGQYNVQAFVQSGLWSGNQFMFISGPYKLVIGDKIYPINYTITDGRLGSISLDNKTNSLTAHIIDAPSGTTLNLELPRELIDAKSDNNGTDFEVLIRGGSADYQNAPYSIIKTNTDSRMMQLPLSYGQNEYNPSGTWDVKITGTKIIPEFPFATPILIISITSLIVFHRMKFKK